MTRYLGLLLSFVLLTSLTSRRADADIAPNPLTGGWPISPYDKETTDVRMMAEDVVVRIYADSIVTVGSFSMINEEATVGMEVGFPFSYRDDLLHFRAFVNGQPVAIRDGQREHSEYEGRKKSTVHWKLWDVTFHQGEACEIRVEYKTKPMKYPAFVWRGRRGSLPPGDSDTLREATALHEVEYTLETGTAWQGVLDRCRVSFELVGMSDSHIIRYQPEGGARTQNGVVWEYTDYEPAGWVSLGYSPHFSAQQIPEILRGIVERFPDNAQLASDVGRFCGSYLAKSDIEREIYHSFLARFSVDPIPQLMEYAPGGRCRFDFASKSGFYTAWRMAFILFKQNENTGTVDRGRDIAPTVSRMSAAIVDSLDTCQGMQEKTGFLYREAKALRDLCNELIKADE